MTKAAPTAPLVKGTRRWLVWALLAHTGWGAYPVLARYLQTVAHLPSMSLLAVSMTVAALFTALTTRPRWRHLLRQRLLWALLAVVALRAVTNLLAARFTYALYVQLITLATPWTVALLSLAFFREPAPRYTGRTALIGTVGALLILSARVQSPTALRGWSAQDGLGLALAGVSMVSLALYMLLVRRSQGAWRGQEVFLVQSLGVLTVGWLTTWALGEDWRPWLHLRPVDWLVFGTFAGLVLYGANRLQIAALQHIGARAVSSLLPWRLVVVLIVGVALLGETLTTWRQAVGVGLVLFALIWYLWHNGASATLKAAAKPPRQRPRHTTKPDVRFGPTPR